MHGHDVVDNRCLPTTFRWKIFPLLQESLIKSCALALSIVIIAVFTTYAFDVYHGGAAFVLLFFSLIRYFLPTHYEVSSYGVKIRLAFYSKFHPWSYYSRYKITKDGVFLSAFSHSSRLESFRNDFLKFGEGVKADEIALAIKEFIPMKAKTKSIDQELTEIESRVYKSQTSNDQSIKGSSEDHMNSKNHNE